MLQTIYDVHCRSCFRCRKRELKGEEFEDVVCDNCGSSKVAVWNKGFCEYSYSGKVEYPFGNHTPFGTPVKGPTIKRRNGEMNNETLRLERKSND